MEAVLAYVRVDRASATDYAYALNADGEQRVIALLRISGDGLVDLIDRIKKTGGAATPRDIGRIGGQA